MQRLKYCSDLSFKFVLISSCFEMFVYFLYKKIHYIDNIYKIL